MSFTAELTREQVAQAFQCTHGELGRLLRERFSPLPVRVEGAILWFADEVEEAAPDVRVLLERRRKTKSQLRGDTSAKE